MVGNTATIYGSYLYPSSTGPQFVPGGSANAIFCLVVAALAIILRFVHKKENRKLEEAETVASAPGQNAEKEVGGEVPEVKRTGFRYIY
jgi:hypothetical protein